MKRKNKLTIAITGAVLAVLGAMAVYAQDKDKYSLKSPSGIAFSDFRGYEDWRWSLPRGPTKCSR
jgi:hypothetical protein